MSKKTNNACDSRDKSSVNQDCCRVEALISVDSRGQMVLPKELRDKAGIKAGDKLAVITWEAGGKLSGMCLMKADKLDGIAKDLLSPMMKGGGKK